jgi:hypothetical protein
VRGVEEALTVGCPESLEFWSLTAVRNDSVSIGMLMGAFDARHLLSSCPRRRAGPTLSIRPSKGRWTHDGQRAGPHIPAQTQGRLLIAVVLLGLLLAPARPVDAVDASPETILTNPARFDGQSVTVRGTISNLRETVSRRGNPYYTLDLSDGKQAIRVFSFGKAVCRTGTATVEGTFARVKQVGRLTFYNEITATQVACR